MSRYEPSNVLSRCSGRGGLSRFWRLLAVPSRCPPFWIRLRRRAIRIARLHRRFVAARPRLRQPVALLAQFHAASEYPLSAQLWEKVDRILNDYKGSRGLCSNLTATEKPSVQIVKLPAVGGAELFTVVIDPSPSSTAKKGAVLCRSPYGPTTQNMADIFM